MADKLIIKIGGPLLKEAEIKMVFLPAVKLINFINKVKVFDKHFCPDILLECLFFRWPPPKSIYLKTLTNSNYVGPLL